MPPMVVRACRLGCRVTNQLAGYCNGLMWLPPRFIGKEVSRRLERGNDISIVDFRCAEYAERMVVADLTLRQRIRNMGIRKTARLAKLDTKTVMLIVRGGRVKQKTLERVANM